MNILKSNNCLNSLYLPRYKDEYFIPFRLGEDIDSPR